MNALTTQSAMKWEILDGEGGVMICPKPGVLVVAQTGEILDDILKLLEDYRFALRTSKVRTSADSDPDEQEQVTYYYRMETVIAVDLEKLLPELVQPETWKSTSRPEAIGTIRRVASRPELRRVSKNEGSPEKADVVLESNSVLIVHQTRKMHAAIRKVLLKIQFGDSGDAVGHAVDGGMAGGMGGTGGGTGGGMGGGGFGGGYFSTPAK